MISSHFSLTSDQVLFGCGVAGMRRIWRGLRETRDRTSSARECPPPAQRNAARRQKGIAAYCVRSPDWTWLLLHLGAPWCSYPRIGVLGRERDVLRHQDLHLRMKTGRRQCQVHSDQSHSNARKPPCSHPFDVRSKILGGATDVPANTSTK